MSDIGGSGARRWRGAGLMAVGWFLAQATANMAFAAFTASLSDQLSSAQYGKVSGLVGIASNLAVLAATWLAAVLDHNMLLLFMVPAVLGAAIAIVYALMIPEPVLTRNRHPFNLVELLTTFWRNPIKYPDFALAWGGRFTIILASFMFVTFRLLYMTNHLGLDAESATSVVAVGVTIYTATSMAASVFGGWLSDKLGRRKILVAASILIFALATYLLLHADTVAAFYVIGAIMTMFIRGVKKWSADSDGRSGEGNDERRCTGSPPRPSWSWPSPWSGLRRRAGGRAACGDRPHRPPGLCRHLDGAGGGSRGPGVSEHGTAPAGPALHLGGRRGCDAGPSGA
ncbi:MFS transporter [Brachybacterium sp.]|uniref:MFS transporter n=1 Tax=Brachybacterium sp. TaxID=1891286 RepID=UPI003F915FC3